MKERPILFSAPMVRAILDGRKTQTRRIVKSPISPITTRVRSYLNRVGAIVYGCVFGKSEEIFEMSGMRCPYGNPGDRLWARETWGNVAHHIDDNGDLRKWNPDRPAKKVNELKFGVGYYSGHIIYRADGEFEWCNDYGEQSSCWHPSIHMPRSASRITLEITNIRVERLQDISEEDAKAEGCDNSQSDAAISVGWFEKPARAFRRLWESINGTESWDANPWVWVIEFKRI